MIHATHLKTEYLTNPIGVDFEAPRFFWNLEDAKKQTAYQIQIKADNEYVWDSGKVISSSMRAKYEGPVLQSRQMLEWSITLWDEYGKPGEASSAYFEMGLLQPSDWSAKWITGDIEIDKKLRYPVDHFKKKFLVGMPVKRARLYITACGLYEAALNDTKVGTAELTPGLTDYRKRVQYQTFDITQMLQQGENTLEIALADGWYRGYIGALSTPNVFGIRTKLLCQFEIIYMDGTVQTIGSDNSFAWSNDGAIRYADLKNGEIIEAGKEPSYTGEARLEDYSVVPRASNNVLVQQHERFSPKLIFSPSGRTILDFGQNIAGFVEFRLKGQKDQKVTLKMGEALDQGEFTQVNFQGKMKNIDQKIEFTCSGGEDFYRTKFAIFGFRYVLVEGLEEVNPNDFCAIAAYSSMEESGDFTCSNELVNQLVRNTRWSMKGNFADVPTDCPTRERAPWTGDAQIFCNTANYLMDTSAFFTKWLYDMVDRQGEDGKVGCHVPTTGNVGGMQYMDGCIGWGDASIFIPYRCYKMYQDVEFLRRFYPMMKSYAEFSIRRAAHPHFITWFKRNPFRKYTYASGQHFGEWLEPKGVEPGNMIVNIILPRPEEATAYFHYQMAIMAEVANTCGYDADEKRYSEFAEGTKKAYNYLFVKDQTIDTARQAKLVRPLALGLLDGDSKKNVENRLEKALIENNWKIGTGFLSTPFILPVLTEAGKLDAAFKVLENEECPGWLYEPKHDATAIWETWEGYDQEGHPTASHNHYSFGAVCEWLFNTVGGINVVGENEFIIAPHYGGSLTFASTKYRSIFGEVTASWKLHDGYFTLDIEVPSNCFATVVMPNSDSHIIESGKVSFQISI
jgi:alpha-L-rhamnosidase